MSRTKKIIAGAIMSLGIATTAASAQSAPGTGIIQDMMMQNCSPESREALGGIVRQAIEDRVKRAEASILPPSPVGDLACLQDLMNAPLDSFSNVGGLMNTLKGSMSGSIGNIPGLGGTGIGDQVCAFAAQKWAELTRPLNMRLADLQGTTRSVSNVWDNFDINLNRSGNRPTGTQTNTGGGLRDGDLGGIDYSDNNDDLGPTGPVTVGDMTEEEIRRIILESMNGGGSGTTPPGGPGDYGYGSDGNRD